MFLFQLISSVPNSQHLNLKIKSTNMLSTVDKVIVETIQSRTFQHLFSIQLPKLI